MTGGEPDVVGHDKETGEYIFYDCSAESPKGRRSVCYDREALESRKEHKPEDNALDMAAAMGIELLTEEQYRKGGSLIQLLTRLDQAIAMATKKASSPTKSTRLRTQHVDSSSPGSSQDGAWMTLTSPETRCHDHRAHCVEGNSG